MRGRDGNAEGEGRRSEKLSYGATDAASSKNRFSRPSSPPRTQMGGPRVSSGAVPNSRRSMARARLHAKEDVKIEEGGLV